MSLDRIHGIGDNDDLRIRELHHFNTVDLNINLVGVITSDPENPPISTEGVSATLQGKLDTWSPVIRHGYFYEEDEEYYLYGDKATETFSATNIMEASGFLHQNSPSEYYFVGSGFVYGSGDLPSIQTITEFTNSGYFEVALREIPKAESPIIVTRLPYDLLTSSVDSSGSGYFLVGSGSLEYAHQYIDIDAYEKYYDSLSVTNSDNMPLYRKQSNIAPTGFIESDRLGTSGIYSPSAGDYGYDGSGYLVQPAVCVSEFVDDLEYPQLLLEDNILRVPGNVCNLMVEYESSTTGTGIIRDIDISPLTSYNELRTIAITRPSETVDPIINVSLRENRTVGNNINILPINIFVTNEYGTPIPNKQIDVCLSTSYSTVEDGIAYASGSGSVSITNSDSVLRNGIIYNELQLDVPISVSECAILDANNVFQDFIYGDSSTTRLTQSRCTFIGSGFIGSEHSLVGRNSIEENTDIIYNGSGFYNTSIVLGSGFVVADCGSVVTNSTGCAEIGLLATENIRTTIITNLDFYIDGELLHSEPIINEASSHIAPHSYADDNGIPQLGTQFEVYGSGLISGSGTYAGSGYLPIQQYPVGGPTGITFYGLNEFFQYATEEYVNPSLRPSPLGYGSGITHIGNGVNVVLPDFEITDSLISTYDGLYAEYKYLYTDVLLLDNYEVIE